MYKNYMVSLAKCNNAKVLARVDGINQTGKGWYEMKRMRLLSVMAIFCVLSVVLWGYSSAEGQGFQKFQQKMAPAATKSPPVQGQGLGPSNEYLLTCIGGKGMVVDDNDIAIIFSKATHGSTQGELAPGECAWLDRGLYPSEATGNRIVIPLPNAFSNFIFLNLDQSGSLTVKEMKSGLLKDWVDRVKNKTKFHIYCYIEQNGVSLIFKRMGP
jgi:hypothetical protein